MSRQYIQCRHEIGEIVGLGPTKRAAQADAIRQAEAFCVSVAPVVVGQYIVWREPNGFAYARSEPGQLHVLCTMGGTLKEACAQAAYHTVQQYWHPGCKLETAIAATGVEQWLGVQLREGLESWITWQEAYNTAKASGCSDDAARYAADYGLDKVRTP